MQFQGFAAPAEEAAEIENDKLEEDGGDNDEPLEDEDEDAPVSDQVSEDSVEPVDDAKEVSEEEGMESAQK